MGELIGNPCPIALRIAVLRWCLAPRRDRSDRHCIDRPSVKPEVIGSPDGIVGVFSRDSVGWIVFPIQKARDTQDSVAIGAGGIAAEGNGEQFERLFLT